MPPLLTPAQGISVDKIENTPISELNVGQTATYEKTVTEEDILMFAKLSGDVNPVHLDEEFAAGTQFGGRIAHGMYTAAIISAAMALKLPGPGSIYMGQTMKFRAPVYIGDTLTVNIEVTSIMEKRNMATLSTDVVNQDGKTVVKGEATALVPTEKLIVDAPELPPISIG